MACCRYRVLHQRPDRCQQRAGVLWHNGYTGPPVSLTRAIAALVGADATADYVIPGQFDERVAPAVAAAVAAQARADQIARR
jgi:hypothetical protein